jgi:hypothetical protein
MRAVRIVGSREKVKRLSLPGTALAGVALVLGITAAITIAPASHNYGRVAVNGTSLASFAVSGLPVGGLVTASLSGANPGDWVVGIRGLTSPTCSNQGQADPCSFTVDFSPNSVGPKSATLVVTDNLGSRATAALTGVGVGALCEMKVVPCNYAHLYDGTFSWQYGLIASHGTSRFSVTVTVVHGVATCRGSQTASSPTTGSVTGAITGPGLIAVEFLQDSLGRLVYDITATCPTADHPDLGGPSRPAEPGGENEMKTYEKLARAVGMNLVGTHSYPAPETDPVNGVTGTVSVVWNLSRW